MKDTIVSKRYPLSLAHLRELKANFGSFSLTPQTIDLADLFPGIDFSGSPFSNFKITESILDNLIICGEGITYRDLVSEVNQEGLWVLAYQDIPVFVGKSDPALI